MPEIRRDYYLRCVDCGGEWGPDDEPSRCDHCQTGKGRLVKVHATIYFVPDTEEGNDE